MGVIKRSVSLDAMVAARVAEAAASGGVSFSTWISNAAEQQLLVEEGLRGVAEWEAEAGPLTATERATAKATVDRLLAESGAAATVSQSHAS